MAIKAHRRARRSTEADEANNATDTVETPDGKPVKADDEIRTKASR